MMPPARCTSSRCTSATHGATLQRHGHAARQAVDIGHGEGDAAFLRRRQQMQHGVGRAAHGDVERHGVLERLKARDGARQRAFRRPARNSAGPERRSAARLRGTAPCGRRAWPRSVPLPGSARPSASVRQFIELAVNMPEQEPQVGQAERSIVRASSSLTVLSAAAIMASIRSTALRLAAPAHLARFHRAAGDENRRNVQPHRRHQHAGRDLVAIGDADQRVGAMGVDHVFDRVGDQLARGQLNRACRRGPWRCRRRSAMVLNSLATPPAASISRATSWPRSFRCTWPGHELGEGIGDRDDRLAEILVLHAGGAPKAARAGHVAAMGGGA